MKIFKDTFDAIKYVKESNIPFYSKKIKIENLKHQGVTKINNVILIVDEYDLLKD